MKPPFDGWVVDYFSRISELTGLECDPEHNIEWNGTYDQYVEHIDSCAPNGTFNADLKDCACEFGIGVFWETPNRANVDFLPDIGFDSIFVVTHSKNTTPQVSATFLFDAFTGQVWGLICVLCICLALLKICDPSYPPSTPWGTHSEQQTTGHFRPIQSFISNFTSKLRIDFISNRRSLILYRLSNSAKSVGTFEYHAKPSPSRLHAECCIMRSLTVMLNLLTLKNNLNL